MSDNLSSRGRRKNLSTTPTRRRRARGSDSLAVVLFAACSSAAPPPDPIGMWSIVLHIVPWDQNCDLHDRAELGVLVVGGSRPGELKLLAGDGARVAGTFRAIGEITTVELEVTRPDVGVYATVTADAASSLSGSGTFVNRALGCSQAFTITGSIVR